MKLDLLCTFGIEYLGDSELLHPYGTEGSRIGASASDRRPFGPWRAMIESSDAAMRLARPCLADPASSS
jgi:hypothetical protein